MEKRVPFDIGAHFEKFIKTEISEGRYRNPSDVVRAALRLLEGHEAQLAAWRLALEDGDTSGFATPFDFDAFIAKKRKLARKKGQKSCCKVELERSAINLSWPANAGHPGAVFSLSQ
jgi:antitoxin ParD1/3/4